MTSPAIVIFVINSTFRIAMGRVLYRPLIATGLQRPPASVHCDDSKWAKRSEEILETTGGRDVNTSEAAPDYQP
jgi:hypothetical protein